MTLNDSILLRVQKPGRYIGGEINIVKKELQSIDIRFAFCFPDVYEVGMSHLGMQLLYFFLNRREDTWCERIFAPWVDMEKVMREEKIPLYALESHEPARAFDFLGFTLQYEMSYTNIINMLDLAGLPLYAKDRGEDFPLVCAGGPCAFNPEPLAEVVDFFCIGDGEGMLDEILDIYKVCKKEGYNKQIFLERLTAIKGVYVPGFYNVSYTETGNIKSISPNNPLAPAVISKSCVTDLDSAFFPDKTIIPLIEIVHDRVSVEVFRGCIRGCRFCQAGFLYRPVRERGANTLMKQAESLVKHSGCDEISLVSLSTADYSGIDALSRMLIERFTDEGVNISLPSLRVDALDRALMEKIGVLRRGSVTFAPEAGSCRLRNVINKQLSDDEIINGSIAAFEAGIEKIKLYFMVGLPTESMEDLKAIAELSEKITRLSHSKRLSVGVSAACFVPKPFTPFQWVAQNDSDTFIYKHRWIKSLIKNKKIKYSYHDSKVALCEGVMARGDRRVVKAIIRAWELGARFDGWTEQFDSKKWDRAFLETGVDADFYTTRERQLDEIFPWDHIDAGVSKAFLRKEYLKSLEGHVTPNCREKCSFCGASRFAESCRAVFPNERDISHDA